MTSINFILRLWSNLIIWARKRAGLTICSPSWAELFGYTEFIHYAESAATLTMVLLIIVQLNNPV